VFAFAAVPLFARLLRFFPTLVIATMIIVIGVNLVGVGGQLITGRPGGAEFGQPRNLLLGAGTIAVTILLYRVLSLSGLWRQLAVMLGLIVGSVLAWGLGQAHLPPTDRAAVAVPSVFPFGAPHFDLLASIPLMIFSVARWPRRPGRPYLMPR
jgi:xanthine/uracil permease